MEKVVTADVELPVRDASPAENVHRELCFFCPARLATAIMLDILKRVCLLFDLE